LFGGGEGDSGSGEGGSGWSAIDMVGTRQMDSNGPESWSQVVSNGLAKARISSNRLEEARILVSNRLNWSPMLSNSFKRSPLASPGVEIGSKNMDFPDAAIPSRSSRAAIRTRHRRVRRVCVAILVVSKNVYDTRGVQTLDFCSKRRPESRIWCPDSEPFQVGVSILVLSLLSSR
jgi:hypothetical protein